MQRDGYWEYPPLVESYGIPIVVTGFEPLDILEGIRRTVSQLEKGECRVENAYERIVTLRRAICRPRSCWPKSSRSPTGPGGVSA